MLFRPVITPVIHPHFQPPLWVLLCNRGDNVTCSGGAASAGAAGSAGEPAHGVGGGGVGRGRVDSECPSCSIIGGLVTVAISFLSRTIQIDACVGARRGVLEGGGCAELQLGHGACMRERESEAGGPCLAPLSPPRSSGG